jgi:hypothetical protein
MTTNEQIYSLLQRIEAVLRRYPHIISWVEQMVQNAESQKWKS